LFIIIFCNIVKSVGFVYYCVDVINIIGSSLNSGGVDGANSFICIGCIGLDCLDFNYTVSINLSCIEGSEDITISNTNCRVGYYI